MILIKYSDRIGLLKLLFEIANLKSFFETQQGLVKESL